VRRNWSIGFIVILIFAAFVLFGLIPWIIAHPPDADRDHSHLGWRVP
jgi:hypothetical protein